MGKQYVLMSEEEIYWQIVSPFEEMKDEDIMQKQDEIKKFNRMQQIMDEHTKDEKFRPNTEVS